MKRIAKLNQQKATRDQVVEKINEIVRKLNELASKCEAPEEQEDKRMSDADALAEMRDYDLGIISDIALDCDCETFTCEHTWHVYAVGDHGEAAVGIPGVVESPWLDSREAVIEWWREHGAEVRARYDAEESHQ